MFGKTNLGVVALTVFIALVVIVNTYPLSQRSVSLQMGFFPMPSNQTTYSIGEFVVVDQSGREVLGRHVNLCDVPMVEIAKNTAETKDNRVIFSTAFGARPIPFPSVGEDDTAMSVQITSISPIEFLDDVLRRGRKNVSDCESAIQEKVGTAGCLLVVVQTAFYGGQTRGFSTTGGCQIINFDNTNVRPSLFPKKFHVAFGVNVVELFFVRLRGFFLRSVYRSL